ncbi:hypothetical protein AB0O01_07270 [Streptomyces sp. NPDC093252]|uniref:hypothetical protein n=1 Tax=Streptomyces sp. NPDC093252 TaxID=3154980 RepID=UPI00344174EB
MTITTGGPPRRNVPLALVRGFLTGGVIGGSLASLVVGVIIEKVPLFVAGLAVPLVYGLLLYLPGARRRAREAEVPPRIALAGIESRERVGEGDSEVPVRFDLTVAPDDAPAYRVEITHHVNLVELPDHRPGGVLVVQYPPDRPWRVEVVRRPTPEWEARAADARIDSAPGPAMLSEPPESAAGGCAGLLALLLGAALIILLFRADLFDDDEAGEGHRPSPAVSSSTSTSTSTSTTVVTSATGTVTLGEGQSLLDEGELRRAMDSLTEAKDGDEALTVVVQERTLTVVFVPTGDSAGTAATPGFDPKSLPYDRIPALVEDARRTLDTGTPRSWQLTADRTMGSLTLRVAVTGSEGTGLLEADGDGEIVRRTPATG